MAIFSQMNRKLLQQIMEVCVQFNLSPFLIVQYLLICNLDSYTYNCFRLLFTLSDPTAQYSSSVCLGRDGDPELLISPSFVNSLLSIPTLLYFN